MKIDKKEIDKRLKERGFYYKSFKVFNANDYNEILQEALKIKQLYKDSWSIKIMQVESCDKIMSIQLEIN